MSGNKVVKTKCRNISTFMDCLKDKFPNLGANWDKFIDPKNGNIAKPGQKIQGIGGGYGNSEAQVRIPGKFIGTHRDIGLLKDEKTGTWSIIGYDEDIEWNREVKERLDAAKASYAEKDTIASLTAKGAKVEKVMDVDSKSIPAHIASKLKPGKIVFIEATVDADSLKAKGLKLRENI